MTNFVSKFLTKIVNDGIIPANSHEILPTERFKSIKSSTNRGGKKSISYWLRIESDFAYGYAIDFKLGIESRFNSARNDPSMTKADIQRVNAMTKAKKAEEDLKIAERHNKIAERARHNWELCEIGRETPYTKNKGIKKLNTVGLFSNNQLFVPVYDNFANPEMVSYQLIRPNGDKKFPFGGKKQGCFHIIGQINPTQKTIICEGFATGASIYEALRPNVDAVIVSFDAGNIPNVVKEFKKVYHNTPIVIAADNDENGTGLKYAKKAQKSTPDVSIVMPDTIGADFNDLTHTQIKSYFSTMDDDGGFQSQISVAPITSASWESFIITDAKNRIVSTSLQNTILYLMHHQDFAGCFAYDEFKQEVIIKKCPPFVQECDFKPQVLSDVQITQTASCLESYGIASSIERVSKAIDVVGDKNKFNSIREYFENLKWDKTPRLDTFLSSDLKCSQESPQYLSFIFKKWMTAGVKRVYEAGCKFDHILIVEGEKQGLYKSSFLRELGTFEEECLYTDSILISELSNKDTIINVQGNIIVELSELSGFSKQEDDVIKSWLTRQIDETRLPYARKSSKFPRQFIIAATTNNTEYLKDPSGNRRYWPFTIDEAIDIDFVRSIKYQLWAEAVHHYKAGLYIGPTPEENVLADIERKKRMATDPWESQILEIIKGLDEFSLQFVIDNMNFKTTEKTMRVSKRISNILKMNGFINRVRRIKDKSVRVWSKEDSAA